MRRLLIALALAAPLAACDPAPNAPVATATRVPDPIEAKIDALPRTLRQATLFRAIRDGGFTCQQIVRWEKKPPVNGKATWVAECDDHGQYVIELQPGGVFWVSGVPQTGRRL